jgi:hypothetical protein
MLGIYYDTLSDRVRPNAVNLSPFVMVLAPVRHSGGVFGPESSAVFSGISSFAGV